MKSRRFPNVSDDLIVVISLKSRNQIDVYATAQAVAILSTSSHSDKQRQSHGNEAQEWEQLAWLVWASGLKEAEHSAQYQPQAEMRG